MRLRDVRNVKRPYERQERFLQSQASQLLNILESDPPEDVKLAYANLNSSDPAWREWSERTIADYKQIKSDALHAYEVCNDKFGQAKEYTTSFHFQILLCVVLIVISVLSMMRG